MEKTVYQTIEGPISGTCGVRKLAAKFQLWALKTAGVTPQQSLAYLVCDKPETWKIYFDNETAMLLDAIECKLKIANIPKPTDFGYVKESDLCYSICEI